MAAQPSPPFEQRKNDPQTEKRLRLGVSKPVTHGLARSLGLGLIIGASDDDRSRGGTPRVTNRTVTYDSDGRIARIV